MSCRRSSRTLLAGLLAVAGSCAFAQEPLPAQEPSPAPAPHAPQTPPDATLERAFWFCDYVASTQGVLRVPAAACRFATEKFKQDRFGGDFEAFLAWWRANKAREHGALAAAGH